MRDALSLLDQLIAFGGGAVSEANARSDARHHRSRSCRPAHRSGGARRRRGVAGRSAGAWIAMRRTMIARWWIWRRLLQRIAIVQIVPEAAPQDEEFDAGLLMRLAQAISPEDAQLYYQIALAGRRDLEHGAGATHRLRNDAAAHVGVSAGRCRPARHLSARPATRARAATPAQRPRRDVGRRTPAAAQSAPGSRPGAASPRYTASMPAIGRRWSRRRA